VGFDRVRDAPATHALVAALVCLFVLSPALFTPWGFGPDFSNHLWLVWQQALAISNTGHPTLYLQTTSGLFEPFYGFYGGTLYATVGGVSALAGGHVYPVYLASIGAAAALAYGGMWWLGRQLGLSRWTSHLPALVVVTGAYYLTDAYARGAWTELVALSAVPMFLAGAARLLTAPWRAGPVALFALATVVLTGSHNLTMFWSVVVIGPIALAAWVGAGPSRPSLRAVAAVVALGVVAVGVNAWFLLLDLRHSADTQAWIQAADLLDDGFDKFFYFNNLGNVLNPLRHFPAQSSTYGLIIAAPVAAFGLSVALAALAMPEVRREGRALRAVWLILLAAMAALIVLLVMPAGWWLALGSPFTTIQFPYRLSGFLLIAIAVQLAISLRFARGLAGRRRRIAGGLALLLVAGTVVQASVQMYSGPRLDGRVNEGFHARQGAFANGPLTPPETYYDPHGYADSSLPVFEPPPRRELPLPIPSPGQTRLVVDVPLPPGRGPISTGVRGGPYVVRVQGVKTLGRTADGRIVVGAPPGRRRVPVIVTADAGTVQVFAGVVSILCLIACLGLVVWLAVRSRLRYRRGPA
jgi:hypothetical protein